MVFSKITAFSSGSWEEHVFYYSYVLTCGIGVMYMIKMGLIVWVWYHRSCVLVLTDLQKCLFSVSGNLYVRCKFGFFISSSHGI